MSASSKNTLTPTFPEEDVDVIRAVKNNRGAICGGYLRDLYAGVVPGEIDVAISKLHVEGFDRELRELGFQPIYNAYNESSLYKKGGRRAVELYTIEGHTDSRRGPIRSVASHDASVNLLNWYSDQIGSLRDRQFTVDEIVAQIHRRETYLFDNEKRYEVDSKGYHILEGLARFPLRMGSLKREIDTLSTGRTEETVTSGSGKVYDFGWEGADEAWEDHLEERARTRPH